MKQLILALNKAKLNFKGLSKDAQAQVGSRNYKYMSLDSILAAVSEPLTREGLHIYHTFSQDHSILTVTCHVTDGESELTSSVFMPMTVPDRANVAQFMGSLITYGKRYSIAALLGIGADEDDDAQSTIPAKPETRAVEKAQGNIVENKRDEAILKWLSQQFTNLKISEKDRERILNLRAFKNPSELREEIEACAKGNAHIH
jgi:hypothetical protein